MRTGFEGSQLNLYLIKRNLLDIDNFALSHICNLQSWKLAAMGSEKFDAEEYTIDNAP